jgi:ribonuclease P protein component
MHVEGKADINSLPSNVTKYTFSRILKHIWEKKHFQNLYSNSKRIENDIVRVYYAPAFQEQGRFAFIASKKVGNAVIRNKCRRRLKEVVRHNQYNIQEEFDMIIVAKKKLITISYKESEQKIQQLLKKNRLLKN